MARTPHIWVIAASLCRAWLDNPLSLHHLIHSWHVLEEALPTATDYVDEPA